MNVSLVDVDSKIPNLALMKLSAYHKRMGDSVKWHDPLIDKPDILYASKVFDFTDDYQYFPDDCQIVRGGSGYDIMARLPEDAENIMPDYDLYGGCDYSMGRFTRGCPNRCPWCIVWRMDGNDVREVSKLTDWWDDRHDTVRVLDDNIMHDADIFSRACEQISSRNLKCVWEALDIRLVNDQTAKALASVRTPRGKCIHFSWDSHAQDAYIDDGIQTLIRNGVRPYRIMFYVMVGFGTSREYDMERIRYLWDTYHVHPFVMPFDKSDRYQKDLARWCNNKFIFKKIGFEDYDCQTNRR